MKNTTKQFLVLLLIAGIFAGCSMVGIEPQDDSILGENVATNEVDSLSRGRNILGEMFNHITWKRGEWGLNGVGWDDRLYRAAFYHAKDMAERNYLSHYTPEGWSVAMRVNGQGFYGAHGEVIATSYDPWQVFNWWMNSTGHRNILMNGYYNCIGVAHYYAYGRNRWCVVLGRR
jgi:uncharacterized protein YkwD